MWFIGQMVYVRWFFVVIYLCTCLSLFQEPVLEKYRAGGFIRHFMLSCVQLCDPMDYTGQNTGKGKLFPSPGDLLNPGTEPRSPTLQVGSLPSKPPGKPYMISTLNLRNLFHICDKLRYFPATKHIPYWKNCAKSSLYKWLSITIGTLICFCHCYFFKYVSQL